MPGQSFPEAIPGYGVIRKIGAGGTSAVFLAQEMRGMQRRVALKILHPNKAQEPAMVSLFLREGRLLLQFDHPRIVKGYDVGEYQGLFYMAIEYVEGQSVLEVLDKCGHLTEKAAIDIILQAADALQYIQQNGYIHRDIKPSNLLLTKDGKVKLSDLGFAQPIGKAPSGAKSETTCGTAIYMSPEQAMGRLDLDIQSDIYSLGATLYHMVMGKVPFQSRDDMEVIAKHVLESLNSAEVKNRGLSPLMLYFIERMMAKEKELRYSNPAELIEDLQAQIKGFESLFYKPEGEC
jgi:serine/threonine-protein kinase